MDSDDPEEYAAHAMSPWWCNLLDNLSTAIAFAVLLVICSCIWVGMKAHELLSRIARRTPRRS